MDSTRKLTDRSPDYQQGFADGYRAAFAEKNAQHSTVEGLNQEAWTRWAGYRKTLGKRPYKTDSVARWLAQYSKPDQERIVEQSISREWQGLFELKPQAGTFKPAGPVAPENYL
jgi:hypothetical protein